MMGPAQPIRSGLPRKVVRTLTVISMVALLGACGGGQTELQAAGRQVPIQQASIDEPVDATSAAHFWNAVRAFPIWETTRRAPQPSTLEGYVDRSDKVVRGKVNAVDVVDEPRADVYDLPNPSAQVVVRVTLSDVVDLGDPERSSPGEPIIWEITAWTGDPALAGDVVPEIRESIGEGPIGGEAILHLSPVVDVETSEGAPPTMFTIGGVMVTDGSAQDLSMDEGGPLSDFTDLDELESAIRGILGTDS